MLAAQHRQDSQQQHEARPIAPDLLVATHGSAACLRIVEHWRNAGLRVVVSVDDRVGADLWRAARELGAKYALTWSGEHFELWDATAVESTPPKPVNAEDVMLLLDQSTQSAAQPAAV
jgi:hypothetical protein